MACYLPFFSTAQVVLNYTYTGAFQTFTVPACVNAVTLECWGAQGGANWISNVNYGGYAKGVFTVTTGNVFYIYAGAQPSGTVGGFNGGGNGETLGQGGGGASDVRSGGNAYLNRIIVAGGAGGAGYWSSEHVVGGLGGGLVGTDGYRTSTSNPGGQGGTQTGSGNGTCVSLNNPAMTGGFGFGGSPSGCGCEGYGGGGGWYGGAGSGNCRGGGGGSGYLLPSATGTAFTTGSNVGHGKVVLSYFTAGSGVSVTPTSAAICTGTNITLTASGVVSYTWSAGSNPNNNSINVSPTSNTGYTVYGTNSLSCISTVVVNVTVSPGVPSLTLTPSASSVCLGRTVNLTATGALTYTWSNSVINGVSFTPSVTNTYTVNGQNGCGISTSVVGVTVGPLPISAVANPTIVCALNPAGLSASGSASSFTWTPGPYTGSTIAVAPSVTTVYTVTASDGTCSGIANVTVTAKPNPTLNIAGTSTNICEGESVSITVGGADSYTWSTFPPSAPITGTLAIVSPTTPTSYQVSGTNSVGCTTGTSYVVVVKAAPIVGTNLSSTVICLGSSALLMASGAVNYTWSSGALTSSTIVSPTVSTVYTVTGAGTNSCTADRTLSVVVEDPALGISASTAICLGSGVSLSAGPGTNFNWSPAGGSFSSIQLTPTLTTIYTASANVSSNGVNCPRSNTVMVTVNPNPTVTATMASTVVCKNDKHIITGVGANTYTWSTGVAASTTTFSSSQVILHTVTLTGMDANGCKDDGSIQVKVNSCNTLNEISGKNLISIFPNPNKGQFTVSADVQLRIELWNALGQIIRTIELTDQNNYSVEISELPNGVFFISASGAEKPVQYKIIVNK